MIAVIFTTVAALLAQSAPASAGTSANSVSLPPASVSPVIVPGRKSPEPVKLQNEMVCQSEPVLGTLFPKRICATRQEATERQRWDQKETREATNLRPWKDEATSK